MKNKYFFIILICVTSSITFSLTFAFYFFNKEMTKSLDLQLEAMASTIFSSNLSVETMDNMDTIDDVISDLFDEERVDRYIRIYNAQNLKLLYANDFAQNMSLPLPSGIRHLTVDYGEHQFRVLEVKKNNIILQVAILADSIFSQIKMVEKNIFFFAMGMILIIMTVTLLSFKALLTPLAIIGNDFLKLANVLTYDLWQIQSATDELEKNIEQRKKSWNNSSFHLFLNNILNFIKRLSSFLQFTQKQYAILAHEFKTPLTIIRTDLETLKLQISAIDQKNEIDQIMSDIDNLSSLTKNFLEWSQSTTSKPGSQDIYALQLKSIILEEINKLHHSFQGIQLDLDLEDVKIFCSPFHIKQLISNILENAIIHGPHKRPIAIILRSDYLSVTDEGKGPDDVVLTQLGMPFNKGKNSTGHGLGLAWIKTICDIYNWQLQFDKKENCNSVIIVFKNYKSSDL